MAIFESQRVAKEYLVGRIVAEAERDGRPLSEIERKMLYFSETDYTLPDMMEVNAQFERDYDNDEYERRICSLGQAIEAELKNAGAEESGIWRAAIKKLSEGDHYLLVLLNPRLVPAAASTRPPGDILKLWLTAVAIAFGLCSAFIVYEHFFGSH